jgi:hypothetical protein
MSHFHNPHRANRIQQIINRRDSYKRTAFWTNEIMPYSSIHVQTYNEKSTTVIVRWLIVGQMKGFCGHNILLGI